jgi:two-component system alkaline phosphatase synthesis response regulator PhoP
MTATSVPGPRLLLLEDDANVAGTLTSRLATEGYAVTHANSVRAAREALAGPAFQVAVLDVGLPDGNGFEVAQTLRDRNPATAVLFLTAYGTPEDRFRELLLRIQNVQKRAHDLQQPGTVPGGTARIGVADVDFGRFTARVGDQVHRLTHKECAVLKLLVERAGNAVTRDEILDRAWSPDEFPTQRTVDNFIVRLRKLVERDPSNPQSILSVRGVGYQLEAGHE